MALTDSIKRMARSLAWLKVEHAEDTGYGTAFVAGRAGEIVTSAHLLRDAGRIEVAFLGSRGAAPSPCTVLASDMKADVALLKAEARDLTPATLWRGPSIAIGREVAFMGFPHSDIFQPPLVMAMRGIVGNRFALGEIEYYVVDASAAEGMSGGPLFLAESGEVVGMIGGRFDPGRTRAKLRGASAEALRDLPAERTNIAFAPLIEYVLALLRGRS